MGDSLFVPDMGTGRGARFQAGDEAVELTQKRTIREEWILRLGTQKLVEKDLGLSRKVLGRREG